jgi:hypothetical protein
MAFYEQSRIFHGQYVRAAMRQLYGLCRTYLRLDLTAEAQSAQRNSLLIKKYSELRELSASVVK